MGMRKKMLLLASMALATAAFAAPAAAQADVWTHNHAPLEGEAEVGLSGFAQFNAGAAGTFGCNVTATLVMQEGSTGEVSQFAPVTSSCVGTAAFAGCELTAHTFVPSEVDVGEGNLTITGATIENTYKAGTCAGGQTSSHLEFPELTVTPDEATTISSVSFSGFATNGVFASGELELAEPETYGIG